MTTDNFTIAARAEAERRHPAPEIETGAQLGYTQTQIREVVRRTFTNAAEWARAHLDAQEPTGYMIDVAMDAYAKASGQPVRRSWMAAALSAARRTRGGAA